MRTRTIVPVTLPHHIALDAVVEKRANASPWLSDPVATRSLYGLLSGEPPSFDLRVRLITP